MSNVQPDANEPEGPYVAGQTVIFPPNRFTWPRSYSKIIDQAEADRLNAVHREAQDNDAEFMG